MDVSAVLSAPEGFLEQLGLSKAGDRLNLVAYRKTTSEKPENSQNKKKTLLEAFHSRKKKWKNSFKGLLTANSDISGSISNQILKILPFGNISS